MSLHPNVYLVYTKIDHRPKCKIQNLQFKKDTIGENVDDLGYDNDLLDIIPKVQSRKEIIDTLDFINIQNFCFSIGNVKRLRRQATNWLAKDTSDKVLLSKIYKELSRQQQENNLIKKWTKSLNRCLMEEDTQMTNKRMKRCLKSYVIEEIQIKTMRYQNAHLKWPKSKTLTIPKAGEDVEQQELSFTDAGNARCCSHFGRQFCVFLQN